MPRDNCLYRFPTLACRAGQLRKKGAVRCKETVGTAQSSALDLASVVRDPNKHFDRGGCPNDSTSRSHDVALKYSVRCVRCRLS